MNDKWLGIFLFFLLTNNSKQLLSLINGEDFDLEFNKLVDDINEVDSDVFKNECLEGLLKNKQMLEDLNKAYKSGGFKLEESGQVESAEEKAKKVLQEQIDRYGQEYDEEGIEALKLAIKVLGQEPITWIVGKDNAQVAVRNMPIDKMQKICAIIEEEEQQPCEDCISREDVLDLAKKGVLISNGSYESVCKAINELPPVIPSIKEWLSSFNTNSATECFTAVQELKKEIENERIGKE